jgi:hypothetical protein
MSFRNNKHGVLDVADQVHALQLLVLGSEISFFIVKAYKS